MAANRLYGGTGTVQLMFPWMGCCLSACLIRLLPAVAAAAADVCVFLVRALPGQLIYSTGPPDWMKFMHQLTYRWRIRQNASTWICINSFPCFPVRTMAFTFGNSFPLSTSIMVSNDVKVNGNANGRHRHLDGFNGQIHDSLKQLNPKYGNSFCDQRFKCFYSFLFAKIWTATRMNPGRCPRLSALEKWKSNDSNVLQILLMCKHFRSVFARRCAWIMMMQLITYIIVIIYPYKSAPTEAIQTPVLFHFLQHFPLLSRDSSIARTTATTTRNRKTKK